MPYRDRTPVGGRKTRLLHGDDLAVALFNGHTGPLADLFYAQRGRPPVIVWSPNKIDLASHIFEDFIGHCWGLPAHSGLPLARSFTAAAAPHREWLMLIEVEGFGHDFRYIEYGRGIVDYYGTDMTGATTSQFPGHIAEFFGALYRAAMHRRQVVLSEHEPPRSVFVRIWRRLIVPLVDSEGFVVRFAVINLPENHLRTGLEVVPFACMVVDEARILRFANAAARRLLPVAAGRDHGPQIDAVLGHPLDLPGDPRSLLEPAGTMVHRRARMDTADHGTIEADVTIGAALYRDRALYVISLLRVDPIGRTGDGRRETGGETGGDTG